MKIKTGYLYHIKDIFFWKNEWWKSYEKSWNRSEKTNIFSNLTKLEDLNFLKNKNLVMDYDFIHQSLIK